MSDLFTDVDKTGSGVDFNPIPLSTLLDANSGTVTL